MIRLHTILHYINRVYTIGVYKSIEVVYHKAMRRLFTKHWRAKAYAYQAAHSWLQVAQVHNLNKSYALAVRSFDQRLQGVITLYPFFFNHYTAQHATHLLGACLAKINPQTPLLWHTDIRLIQRDSQAQQHFDQSTFYSDIGITQITQGWKEYKDIKLAWELSRLQFLIAQAVECYTTKKDTTTTVYEYVLSWYKHNPFLLGVNWLCPMEVGLRAITIVWLVSLLNELHAMPCFIVQTMHDHMTYLENNWEWYDGRTSNHYLSNLVGYLYCCWFFGLSSSDQKVVWCFNALETEIKKQVFIEGADYEGSSCYHALVLELFHHALHIASLFGHTFSEDYHKRYAAMISFYYWCSYAPNKIIQIGDNDSGKVLTGIEHALLPIVCQQEHSRTFAAFGISFVKTKVWHVSLRHHAYTALQPSGHFHNDSSSITLAYNGIPLIVDPGSYVYTASSKWRNLFKSAAYHSVCLLDDMDPIGTTSSLFFSPIKPATYYTSFKSTQLELYTTHELYADYNLRFHRSVSVVCGQFKICDWWEPINSAYGIKKHQLIWYFVLAARLKVVKSNDKCYTISNNAITVDLMVDSPLECIDSYVSDHYGCKQPSYRIRLVDECVLYKKYITTFSIV